MYYLIEQTNACQLRCPCCPNRLHQRPTGFMTPDLFRSIVDQLLAHDCEARTTRIPLHGTGEPLLSPHFWGNLDYLEEKGFRQVDFTSNGLLMTAESAERLTKYHCLAWVRISMNSARREVFDKINEGSDYDTVVRHAREFLSIVRAAGEPFKPCVQLMTSRRNEDETISEMQALFGEDASVVTARLHTFAGQCDPDRLAFPFQVPGGCRYGNHCIYFHWNGDMAGCCFDDGTSQIFGNARDGIFSREADRRRGELSAALAARDWEKVPLCAKCFGVSC